MNPQETEMVTFTFRLPKRLRNLLEAEAQHRCSEYRGNYAGASIAREAIREYFEKRGKIAQSA